MGHSDKTASAMNEHVRNGSPSDTDKLGNVWMDHAAVVTADLTRAIEFYSNVVGLRVHTAEADPLREGRTRAMLYDSNGRDILELIEMVELRHRAVVGRGALHHLGFRLPESDWLALQQRLEAADYPFHAVSDLIFVRDPDGLLLEVIRF